MSDIYGKYHNKPITKEEHNFIQKMMGNFQQYNSTDGNVMGYIIGGNNQSPHKQNDPKYRLTA